MIKSITISGTSTKTISFNYSADNERVLKTESNSTTKNSSLYIRGNPAHRNFSVGGNDYPITEKINLNTALSDKTYIYGPTGLIAFKDATSTYFVIKDHLDSTRVLFRGTGRQLSIGSGTAVRPGMYLNPNTQTNQYWSGYGNYSIPRLLPFNF